MSRLCLKVVTLAFTGLSLILPFKSLEAAPVSRLEVRELERIIKRHQSTHLVTGYELGEVYWSQRVIKTLGVGTHMILSPTGGWGQSDLELLAVSNARQKIERLSAEIFREKIEVSLCDWNTRSRMFHAQSPRWLSDGSVHLSAMIRFEVFEGCEHKRGQRDHLVIPPLKALSKAEQTQWLYRLEDQLSSARRAIIFAHVTLSDGGVSPLNCLSPAPFITDQAHTDSRSSKAPKTDFQNDWRAVRWFWRPKGQSAVAQEDIQKLIQPTLNLGRLSCLKEGTKFILEHTGSLLSERERQTLKTAQGDEGGAELWLWLDRVRK